MFFTSRISLSLNLVLYNLSVMIRVSMLIFLGLIFVSQEVNAQEIERSVIGVAGSEGINGKTALNSTVGEAVIRTLDNNPYYYTQGFQQPIFFQDTISYNIVVEPASCVGQDNGFARVENITGCEAPYTILWSNSKNGEYNGNLSPGSYFVQISSANGCTSHNYRFKVGLISSEPCLIKFYSGFTPNNDGFNDTWIIDNVNLYPENEINIYNRLGSRVYKAKNYDNDRVVWRGQNLSGEDSPSDTYFFVFEADDIIEKGWIELTR